MSKFLALEQKIAAGVATEADFAEFAAADVARIKAALPYVARGRVHQAEVEAVLAQVADGPAAKAKAGAPSLEDAARAARTKTLIFNVQLPDRMGDIVIANPADAKKYGGSGYQTQHWMSAGGPYLWCHDPYDGGAVGRVTNPRAEKVKATLGDGSVVKAWGFIGEVEFLADENLEHALESWAMVQAGMTASSIGFIPRVSVYIDDEEERNALGLGRFGVLYPEVEILEVSHVLIPANPWSVELDRANGKTVVDAVRKMQGQGLLTASRADRLVQRIGDRQALNRARIVAPALGELLAPKLKGAQVHAGRPCQGLECMAATATTGPGVTLRLDLSGSGVSNGAHAEDIEVARARRASDLQSPDVEVRIAAGLGADPQAFEDSIRQHRAAVIKALGGTEPHTDCGCGAKTLQQQLDAEKAARATAEARVRELEALPEIRNAHAVRRAMDAASECVEQLAISFGDDENVEDALEPPKSRSTVLLDLQAVQADASLLAAIEPLMRVLAAKARSGAPRVAAAPVTPRPRVVGNPALVADLNAAVAGCKSAGNALGARSA